MINAEYWREVYKVIVSAIIYCGVIALMAWGSFMMIKPISDPREVESERDPETSGIIQIGDGEWIVDGKWKLERIEEPSPKQEVEK